MKILMVCLGNICRSPLAEGVMRHMAEKAGLNWTIDSAGTAGHNPGCPPHRISQKVALLNGFDICEQQCRQLEQHDIFRFDKIYVMDKNNLRDSIRVFGHNWDPAKVDLLMNEVYPGKHIEIPDPWYGTEEGYHEVYKMISKACQVIINKYGETTSQQPKF